ncbi:MAG TPA: HAD family hydrolase [Motilibacteraceae bacterium]|nr:HAD family hydrolase [Motilibacteraceae bacterium]
MTLPGPVSDGPSEPAARRLGRPDGLRDGWVPKLVALDLDGTVLRGDETLSDVVREAVGAAREAGAHVVVATGRTVVGALDPARDLGLAGSLNVCSNGAVTAVLDPLDVVDMVTFDPAPVVRALRQELPDALFAVEVLGTGHLVTGPFPEGELTGAQTVVDLDELLANPATRVVMRSPDREPAHFLELVRRLGLEDVSYAVGYTAWLDVAPQGVSKASGLEGLARRLGVDPADVLAVGDGRNDLEMLRWAGCGIAMGQAPAEVQDAADLVTGPVDEDGLATALSWFFDL